MWKLHAILVLWCVVYLCYKDSSRILMFNYVVYKGRTEAAEVLVVGSCT